MKAQELNLKDGEYTAEVTLEGGTGRATIESPTRISIQDQEVTAEIKWSSSHYDYMLIDGEKFLPVNTEGNSTFEIPVTEFDEPMTVVADTTAMSVPHEVEYTLTFASETITSGSGANTLTGPVIGLFSFAVVICLAGLLIFRKKRKGKACEK